MKLSGRIDNKVLAKFGVSLDNSQKTARESSSQVHSRQIPRK
jgi:hypothetical protein